MNLTRNVFERSIEVYKKYSYGAPGFKSMKAYWNWIRANYEMATSASIIKARPLKLSIDVTNTCQLSCPICPTGLRLLDRPISNLSLDLFKDLLDEIGDFVFFIDFYNWGEPLINKKIDEYIKMANQRKIWTTISSNLSLPLSDQRIQGVIESGLSELIISVDGASPETYPTYRQGGDFELVTQNMQRFVQIKKALGRKNPFIIWRFLVFRFNENEIQKASELAAEYDVDAIVFGTPFVDQRYPNWISTNPNFQLVGAQDAAEPPDSASSPSSNKISPQQKNRTRCDWHYLSSTMNPDGSIAPCCALFGKNNDFASFNGKEKGSYMAAVNNEKYQTIRDRFAGRIDHVVDIVCEHCPAPHITNMGKITNQLISVLTAVQFMEGMKRLALLPLRLFQTSNHH
jgi:MoaA/NifB/PqqE/SkfB family radical SAM enzyme